MYKQDKNRNSYKSIGYEENRFMAHGKVMAEIYLQGRMLDGKPNKGIFIENDKKVVIK